MLEIKHGKNITVFFPDDNYVTKQKCNTCCYVGISKLHDEKNTHIDYKSLISDISADSPDFYEDFSKTLRYDIRRSYNDDISFEVFSPEQVLNNNALVNSLSKMYTEMYRKKGIEETVAVDALMLYASHGGIIVTSAKSKDETLVYHTYIVDGTNARLWMSCSVFRNNEDNKFRELTGRANKRLHYEDMLWFRSQGYKTYDWGGITSFDEPDGVDSFKMAFGGKRKEYFDETCIHSFPHKILRKITEWFIKHKSGKI